MKIRATFLPLLLSLLFVAGQSRAAGLIGQTYAVCVAQLGAPTKHVETGRQVVSDLWTFTQGDWSIEVGVWKGVVHLMKYARVDGQPLEPEQIRALLVGFADKYSWTTDSAGNYRRTDRLLKAKPDPVTAPTTLTFLTTELARAL